MERSSEALQRLSAARQPFRHPAGSAIYIRALSRRLIQFLRAASLRRVSLVQGQAIAAAAVVVAAAARFAASPLLGAEVSLITAIPAVLTATFFAGAIGGVTTVLLGATLDILIACHEGRFAIGPALPRLAVGIGSALIVLVITVQLRAVIEALTRREEQLKVADARSQLLIHELEHRGRNALAIVQALSSDVARSASSVGAYRLELEGRLNALAASYGALTSNAASPVPVVSVVRQALKPFGRQIRINGGPDCSVSPKASLPLSLALHELATNATKYGALSRPCGVVTIEWCVQPCENLDLTWSEVGGPRPVTSTPEGFGSTLLRRIFKETPGGAFNASWRPEGMAFRLSTQIIRSEGSQPAASNPFSFSDVESESDGLPPRAVSSVLPRPS